MIAINLRSYIKDATPEDVFLALSDRESLHTLMPRMRKVEFRDQGIDSETIVMHVSVGNGFGTIRCEGTLSWFEPREVKIQVHAPLPVEVQWNLTPVLNGTELDIALSLDLQPMLGPMERFVPRQPVEDMMVKEMKYAIQQVAKRVKEGQLQERAVAA